MSVSNIKAPNPRTGYFYKSHVAADNNAKSLFEWLLNNGYVAPYDDHAPFFVTLMHGSMWWFAGGLYTAGGTSYGSCLCGTYNTLYKILVNNGTVTATAI